MGPLAISRTMMLGHTWRSEVWTKCFDWLPFVQFSMHIWLSQGCHVNIFWGGDLLSKYVKYPQVNFRARTACFKLDTQWIICLSTKFASKYFASLCGCFAKFVGTCPLALLFQPNWALNPGCFEMLICTYVLCYLVHEYYTISPRE